jgi:Ankyrin repeats (3 copies)
MLRRLRVAGSMGLGVVLLTCWVAGAIPSAWADGSVPPVVSAAKTGDVATLKRLLEGGGDPNSSDANALTALNWAAYNGYLAAVELLVQHRADINAHGNAHQWTPLMNAAAEGHIDIASYLVAHGANVNALDADGSTALDYAFAKNHSVTAAFLKSHGAKGVTNGYVANPEAQALCNAGTSAGFNASDLAWQQWQKGRPQYFCQAVKHDLSGGAGDVLMFTYEVDGNATGAKTVSITADIYDDQLPRDRLGKTLQPLLNAIFSAAGKSPVPNDVAGQVASISVFKSQTSVGAMAARYTPGRDAGTPYNGAKYEISIQLGQ